MSAETYKIYLISWKTPEFKCGNNIIQLILLIHRFCICKLACSLKCTCNPKSNTYRYFVLLADMIRMEKNLCHSTRSFPVQVEGDDALPSCSSSHTVIVPLPWSIYYQLKEKRRRKWQPISVFLPGESHGQRSLVGYSPWGYKELDTTERQK